MHFWALCDMVRAVANIDKFASLLDRLFLPLQGPSKACGSVLLAHRASSLIIHNLRERYKISSFSIEQGLESSFSGLECPIIRNLPLLAPFSLASHVVSAILVGNTAALVAMAP